MKVPLWLLDSLGYFLRQLFFWVGWNWANFRMEFFWMKQESNPGPLNYEPTRLTTRPPSRLSLCRCCLHFNFRRKQGRTDFEPKVEKQHSAFDWCKLQSFGIWLFLVLAWHVCNPIDELIFIGKHIRNVHVGWMVVVSWSRGRGFESHRVMFLFLFLSPQ